MARNTPLERYRNIGISAHIDAGKTTTTERILFYTGVNHKIGEVHDGRRHHGLDGAGAGAWHHDHVRCHDLLLEGHGQLVPRAPLSTSSTPPATWTSPSRWSVPCACWTAPCMVYCAVGGVQPQSETVWRQANKYKVPRLAFVNKMDRTGANFFKVYDQMRLRLKANPVAIVIPIGAEDNFTGVVDLRKMKAIIWDEASQGMKFTFEDIPANLVEQAKEWREKMVEAAAEASEELMNKYLEEGDLTEAEITAGLRARTLACEIQPMLCGTAFKNKGVQRMLDAVVELLPLAGGHSPGRRHRRRRASRPAARPTTKRSCPLWRSS